MKIIKHYDLVYEIEDFISSKHQEELLNLADKSSEEDWPRVIENEFVKEDTEWGGNIYFLDRNKTEWVEDIEAKIRLLFEGSTRINAISAIQRYKPGANMQLHEDDTFDKLVKFGLVIYLNDNYTGGEIVYPTLKLKIKPKERSLIIHPANLPHSVEMVGGQSTRYILSTFVSGESVRVKEEILYEL